MKIPLAGLAHRSGLARVARRALAQFGRQQLVAAALLGTAIYIYHVIVIWSTRLVLFFDPSYFRNMRWDALTYYAFAFALVAGLRIADRVAPRDWRRRLVYAAAAIAAAAMAALLLPLSEALVGIHLEPLVLVRRGLYVFTEMTAIGGAIALVYTDVRWAKVARNRVRAKELERAEAARVLLETRLQEMQARVEPQFLFNTLGQVSDLYKRDGKRAKQVLDELISYLRAAMPQMRSTTSTLRQEIELARAYLGIVAMRAGMQLQCEVDVAGGVGDPPFPPMLLLPLIEYAIRGGGSEAVPQRTLRIRALRADQRLQLCIFDSDGGFAPETATQGAAGIRERLHALFGADAALTLHCVDGHATKATLTIPCDT